MNKKVQTPRMYRSIKNSVLFTNGAFIETETQQEVFVPLTEREENFYFEAVNEAEKKHKRILTQRELYRIGEITEKYCERV